MAYQGLVLQIPRPVQVVSGMVGTTQIKNNYKYGSSTVISSSYVDVWPAATTMNYLTSAETVNCVSGSASDDLGGVGLEKIKIYGLDSSWNEISETVSLDGTNPVTTSNSYIRINRVAGTQSNNGANDAFNVGLITLTSSSSAKVMAYLPIGTNNTLQIQYAVPNGFYAAITEFSVTVQSGDQANFRPISRNFGEPFTVKQEYNIVSSSSNFTFDPPILLAPKSDLSVRAIKVAGAGTVTAACSYDFYLISSSLVSL